MLQLRTQPFGSARYSAAGSPVRRVMCRSSASASVCRALSTAGRGRVTSPLIGWHDFALRDALQQELGVAVLVDNDVNTLATAERLYGRGRDVEDFITLTLGRGVGLGIVANGDIYHGHGGGAGEFGPRDGRP